MSLSLRSSRLCVFFAATPFEQAPFWNRSSTAGSSRRLPGKSQRLNCGRTDGGRRIQTQRREERREEGVRRRPSKRPHRAIGTPVSAGRASLILASIILLLSPLLLGAATYTLDWDVVSAGGGTSGNATYLLSDTVGQTAVSVCSAGPYLLEDGFWPGMNATAFGLVVTSLSSQRARGMPWTIAISDLLTNALLPNRGSLLAVTAVGSPQVSGASASVAGGFIFYSPAPTNGDIDDSFTYTVTHTGGASGQGTINLTVPAVSGVRAAIGNVTSDGAIHLQFDGIPGFSYAVQRASPNPRGPWATLATITADLYGRFFYDDTAPPPGRAFYRAISP